MPAYVTRTGVLTYRRADGSVVRELRHPDDVFRADSLETLRDAPVTVGHPGDGLTWVDPQNAHDHEVGVVHDVHQKAPYVDARLSVRRADVIRRIDAKELVEVSAAYDAQIDPTPGVYEGEAYDQRQTGITYNHVALLPPGKGRAGQSVRLRLDSADAVIEASGEPGTNTNEPAQPATETAKHVPPSPPSPAPEAVQGGTMTTRKLRVDGVEYELPESAASVLEKVVKERDDHKKRADEAEAQRDIVRADLDKARDPKTVAGLVGQRVELERAATKVLGAEQRFDGLSDRDVREKVLAVVSPSFKIEGRTDDAVSAAFEYAIASQGTVNHGIKAAGAPPSTPPEQGAPATNALDFAKEFAALEQKRQTAWKGAAGKGA